MPSTSLKNAEILAKRICLAVSKYDFKEAGHVTCSIGLSEYVDKESSDSFVKRGDDALYLAKRNGRNRVEKIQ